MQRWITRPHPKHRHTVAAMLRESESYLLGQVPKRDDYDEPDAPPANSLVGIDSEPRHVIAYDEGEVRQECWAFIDHGLQHRRQPYLG